MKKTTRKIITYSLLISITIVLFYLVFELPGNIISLFYKDIKEFLTNYLSSHFNYSVNKLKLFTFSGSEDKYFAFLGVAVIVMIGILILFKNLYLLMQP